MSEKNNFPTPQECLDKIENSPILYEELEKIGRKKNPQFYENYDNLKKQLSDIEELSKEQLFELKDVLKNYQIMEEILMTGTSNRVREISFFNTYKSLKLLIMFYTEEDLYLSGLKTIDENHAMILSKFKGKYIYLEGLDTISDEVFEKLLYFRGTIVLKSGLELSDYQLSLLNENTPAFFDIPRASLEIDDLS